MQNIFYLLIGTILFITLLANPAPQSFELIDAPLIVLPVILVFLTLIVNQNLILFQDKRLLISASFLYVLYLFISMFMAASLGFPFGNIIRSIGPYLNFTPLLMLGFLPATYLNLNKLIFIFVVIGILQAIYELYLFVAYACHATSIFDILRYRITLLDPRTTLPLILSSSQLPLGLLSQRCSLNMKVIILFCVLLSFIAGASTLTRSIILSIMTGWLFFCISIISLSVRQNTFSIKTFIKKAVIIFSVSLLILSILTFIPAVKMMFYSILSRFGVANSSGGDYSNGRLYDEWLPAFLTFANANIWQILFGIGAGHAFITPLGEERTYIHNLSLYSLVYGGFFGFFAYILLYFSLIVTFLKNAFASKNIQYLSFASLVVSLFFYSQLFAVHKGLAYNAMLFVLIGIALKPAQNNV